MSTPTDPAYFERLYAESADPWRFATSDYERAKYAATVAALGERHFAHGLEIGCSIGVLSRALASRCDAFLGIDVAEPALVQARAWCGQPDRIRFERRIVPKDWPEGLFDLIVFSEVLYYLGDAGIAAAAERSRASLASHGLIVLVNWLGDTGTGCTGDAAATAFLAALACPARDAIRTGQYRLDVVAVP